MPNTKDFHEAYKSLRDPGIYFPFMGIVCGDKYDKLVDACFGPIFLWDLFCQLSMDEDIDKRNTFKVVDKWLDMFYEEKYHNAIKEELEELGGFEDWEVLYTVFLIPLGDYLDESCCVYVCNDCNMKMN